MLQVQVASGKGSSASIGRTSFRQVGNDICSICGTHSFAPLRVCVCLYLLRSTSGDSLQTIVLFFGRATGQQDKRTPSTASHLLLLFQACRKCLLFCPSPVAPISWPGLLFCAPARVYNFSCFTAVVRLLLSFLPRFAALLSFLLFFFVAVHLIFKRNLLLPGATVSSCPLCLPPSSCFCWLVQPGILWSISKMTWTKHWRQLWSVFGWQLQRAVNFFCVLCPLALITFLP